MRKMSQLARASFNAASLFSHTTHPEVIKLHLAYSWQSKQMANFAPHLSCHARLSKALFDIDNKLSAVDIFRFHLELLAEETDSINDAEIKAILGIQSTHNFIYYMASEVTKLYRHTQYRALFEIAAKHAKEHQLKLGDCILKSITVDRELDNDEMIETKSACIEMIEGIELVDHYTDLSRLSARC